MALIRFNSNRVIDGMICRVDSFADVENWQPLVESGAASLVERAAEVADVGDLDEPETDQQSDPQTDQPAE